MKNGNKNIRKGQVFMVQQEQWRADVPQMDNELSQYQQGMEQGQCAFQEVHQGHILTEEHIYDLLMTMLLNPTHPSLWNAGYIMGWTKAYYHNSPVPSPLSAHVLAEQSCQQEIARLLDYVIKGELTLREAANIVDGVMLFSLEELEGDYFACDVRKQHRVPHPKVPYDI